MVPPGGGFQPDHFMESYFCHSTKVTKNEGAQPLLRCVIFSDAEEIIVGTSMVILRLG